MVDIHFTPPDDHPGGTVVYRQKYLDVMGKIVFAESPHLAAIYAGAVIEEQLRDLINAVIVATGPRIKPEASLSANVLMARRLGLIDNEVHGAIQALGSIRNQFAHRYSQRLDFTHPSVTKHIDKLFLPETRMGQAGDLFLEQGWDSYQGRWIVSVNWVISFLLGRKAAVERITPVEWSMVPLIWPEGTAQRLEEIALKERSGTA